MQRQPVYLWLVLVPFFWGMNFHYARHCVEHLPPNTVGALRFIIATLLLVPLFLLVERPRWRDLQRHLPAMAAVGVLGVFGYNYFFFKAMETTSPTNASLLLAFNPLATLLLSLLWLKTPVRPLQWGGVLLGMVGVLLILSRGDLGSLAALQVHEGDLLLLLVALSFACANVIVRRYLQAAAPLATSAVSTVVGTLLLLGALLLEPQPPLPLQSTPGSVWLALLGMTLGGSIVGYIAWNHSVARVGADKAAVFTNLTPFYTVVISVGLGQPVEGLQLVGGGCIIGGILLATISRKPKVAVPGQPQIR